MVETWLWEKEASHRLFNFHQGYRILDRNSLLNRQKGSNSEFELIGSDIIQKNGANDIQFLKSSEHKDKQIIATGSLPRDERRLVNVVYHEGHYYLYEPDNTNKTHFSDNAIDNHLWLIMRYMPKKCARV